MDLDDLRVILLNSGVDVWTLIETAISVAASDHGDELKNRRDGIVERLYATVPPRCRNCGLGSVVQPGKGRLGEGGSIDEEKESSHEGEGAGSPISPQSVDGVEEQERSHEDLIDEEQREILSIKEHLEDPDQSEECLVELLQNLADMDITFKALKETDIGRHVNRLRKHPSKDVCRLVKQLVRRWKDLVDEWVKLKTPGELASSALITDGDSPLQSFPKISQNGRHQIPDFAFSPNPHNGGSSSDKHSVEGKPPPRREVPAKPAQAVSVSAPALNNQKEKEITIDAERFASARRRLHENYQEAQNAKKQRTIQVMGIHEIPKPKNGFIAKNKGGSHARHW